MRKLLSAVLLFTTLFSVAQQQTDPGIHLADPTIFFHEDVYYLYGTVEGASGEGFMAYVSTDLKTWKRSNQTPDGYVLRKGEAYGTKGFWAPQVFKYQGIFYMAYVANENIAIARSSSPLGPFTQADNVPLAAPVKQIDPFVFIDDDGKKYLYHVRLTEGNRIFVAEMHDDFSGIKEATVRECITATERWENTAAAPWPVAEGPTVLKRNKQYYLFYTANDFRNPDYATGYAVSDSPYGPFKKFSGNPILHRSALRINGTGHGDFFRDRKGNLQYVFHTHYSDSTVAPRRTAIIPARFTKARNTKGRVVMELDKKGLYFLRQK